MTHITINREVVEQALEALDKLMRLGNEPLIGNSIGNEFALAAYKPLRAALEVSKEINLPDYVTVGEPVQWEYYANALIEIAELNAKLNEAKEVEPFGYWFPRERRFATLDEGERYFDSDERAELLIPLYTHPEPAVEKEQS